MPIYWFIGWRFLREGRMQSVLIVAGVAVGVGVIVFLSALISGLQTSLIKQTLGTQAHVVVRPREEAARELRRAAPGVVVAARVDRPAQRVRSIQEWPKVMAAIARLPGVRSVSPMVAGSAFAVRGLASKSIALLGVQPELYRRVFPVADKIVQGRYGATGDAIMIGVELAGDLGVEPGDKIRIVTATGRAQMFTVGGVFDLGNRDVNRRWAIVSMRSAQTLLDLVGGASNLDVKIDEIFAADDAAAAIEAHTGLLAESWMKTNAQLLVGLRSQSSSSTMIQVFVILAVAMGIASVLVVSVVQKSREIGILRAMGTSRRTISAVFLLEGATVGLVGSILGIALGIVLSLLFASLAKNPDGSATFPVDLNAVLFVRSAAIATLTGLVSAVAPARRAARLDPAVAIRG